MSCVLGLNTLLVGAMLNQPDEPLLGASSGGWIRMLIGSLAVLGLLGLWAWFMRRGMLTKRTNGTVTIETAVSLGERRSLVIVAVEGRRFLIGLTPASVSLVTSLEPRTAGFDHALERASQQETAKAT